MQTKRFARPAGGTRLGPGHAARRGRGRTVGSRETAVAGADVATIADQSLERLGGRTSILARQRADHARLDRLMARARTTVEQGGIAHQVALRALARLVVPQRMPSDRPARRPRPR